MALSNKPDVVKKAIEVCTSKQFKKNVFLTRSSGKNSITRKQEFEQHVENNAAILLENHELENLPLERVMGTIFAIATRTLTWLVYYEGAFDIPREYSIDYLDSSSFTQVGILDEEKMGHRLIRDERISAEQKFQIACVYCFKCEIPALFRQIRNGDLYNEVMQEERNLIRQPALVIFWTYYAMGEINKLYENKSIDQCRIDMAIKDGSKPALVYCLEKTSMRVKIDQFPNALRDILMMIVRETMQNECSLRIFNDFIIFREKKYSRCSDSWIPNHCFIDMLYFLISKMSTEHVKSGFSKFFMTIKYDKDLQNEKGFEPLKGLEFLFRWPHQEHFMNLIRQLWDILPEKIYSYFLLEISEKTNPSCFSFLFGEEKYLDHWNFLMMFWEESPNNFKRYVFSERQISPAGGTYFSKVGSRFLIKLLVSDNIKGNDRQNLRIILSSLNSSEKRNFISCKETIKICKDFVKMGETEVFNELVSECFDSEEEALCFKKTFIYVKIKHQCIEFVKLGEWKNAEALLNSHKLSGEEIVDLKRKLIRSKKGKLICLQYFFINKQLSDKFIEWCFETEERIHTFKYELIFSHIGMTECLNHIVTGSLELADYLVNWCLPEMEIDVFKRTFLDKMGFSVCQSLILDAITESTNISEGRMSEGGRWQDAEVFLSWCCMSEKNVSCFKKKLYDCVGEMFLYRLVEMNAWKETENFFKWLDLSQDEILGLRKRTFFNYILARAMFEDLMDKEEGDEKFRIYGSKNEIIKKLLLWYLTDLEALEEFVKLYHRYRDNEIIRLTLTHLYIKYTMPE